MDLPKYEDYPGWFQQLPAKSRERLADNGLDPPTITKRVAALESGGASQSQVRDEKISVLYRAFYHISSPSTQAKLREAGLVDAPGKRFHAGDGNRVESNQFDQDPGESNLARVEAPEIEDDEADIVSERFRISRPVALRLLDWVEERVQRQVEILVAERTQAVVATFLAAPNAKIAAGGLAFACNLASLNGLKSQAAYARRIHVTRAALSKSVRQWKLILKLRTNQHMKSDAACESYRQTGLNNHWRRRKYGA